MPLINALITFYMVGFDATAEKLAWYTLVVILIYNAGGAMGVFIASIFPDLTVALQVVPLVMMPFMMFSGFFVNSNNIPVYFNWISYSNYLRSSSAPLFLFSLVLRWLTSSLLLSGC